MKKNAGSANLLNKSCCLPAWGWHSLSFLLGAIVLAAFSAFQKGIIGETHLLLLPRAYVVPVLYGGIVGVLIGGWYRRLRKKEAALLHSYDVTIAGWAKAIELRDKATENHSHRVAVLTEIIARQMGISEAELVHIRRGALLHDIGKIAVSDVILNKPECLTAEERVLIEEHPSQAYEMLRNIDFLRPALSIPLYHHERWDGKGYPKGLAGEEIPIEARIFSVVDVWDALTSKRPYRDAWTEADAIAYIEESAGTLFDPDVVRAFLASSQQ